MSDPTPIHLLARRANYDRFPAVEAGERDACLVGWEPIAGRLRATGASRIAIETYPGVRDEDVRALVAALGFDGWIDAREALLPEPAIEALVGPWVTDDPVFGRLSPLTIDAFQDPARLAELRDRAQAHTGSLVVTGPGASRVLDDGVLVYADLPRWETQLRMRAGVYANLGLSNHGQRWQLRYKHAYFVDWRVADRLKKSLWERMDFVLDTVDAAAPKMIEATTMLEALRRTAHRPFRVVPYFDPAPWGGQWMKTVCDLDPEPANYGWCFDCVPEENSLLLAFGEHRFEIPAQNLVYREPRALLGTGVYGRFGDEFPIRFDFLDTMGGSNLSLQVHPLTEYIQEQFGMHYTQDESYYLLDAEPEAHVYLGVRDDVDRAAMLRDLRRAEAGEISFPAETYVNRFPGRRHDHFLIPAGTLHCSSRCMVLEISATPYIFTFKLWDWDRPGLDGRPRPVHIDHGEQVIRWDRDTAYARAHLINRIEPIAEGPGWREERTGLHPAEFIETRRHWFTGPVPHADLDRVSVLNLVEGEEAVVSSPDDAFEPFEVHYAETFIVPAGAGAYTITPTKGPPGRERDACATIKAYVRTEP